MPSSRNRVMEASPVGMVSMTAEAPCSKSLKQDKDDMKVDQDAVGSTKIESAIFRLKQTLEPQT